MSSAEQGSGPSVTGDLGPSAEIMSYLAFVGSEESTTPGPQVPLPERKIQAADLRQRMRRRIELALQSAERLVQNAKETNVQSNPAKSGRLSKIPFIKEISVGQQDPPLILMEDFLISMITCRQMDASPTDPREKMDLYSSYKLLERWLERRFIATKYAQGIHIVEDVQADPERWEQVHELLSDFERDPKNKELFPEVNFAEEIQSGDASQPVITLRDLTAATIFTRMKRANEWHGELLLNAKQVAKCWKKSSNFHKWAEGAILIARKRIQKESSQE